MANYDELIINISAKADISSASRSINSLTKNLTRLQNFINNDLDIAKFELIEKHLQNISKIDFTNVSQGLKDVVSAFKAFNNAKFMKATKEGGDLSGAYESEYEPNFATQTQLPELVKPNWQTVENLEITMKKFDEFKDKVESGIDYQGFVDVESHVLSLDEALAGAGLNLEQIKAIFSSIKSDDKLFDEANLENAKKVLERFGYTAEQIERILSRLKTTAQDSGKGAEKSASGFTKLARAFKRILFYRVVRRIIQLIGQAMLDGIKNVALFDSEFNQSMSQIVSSFDYLKNSLGAMLAPLIQFLTPLITFLTDTVAELANKFAEMFSALNGKDTFTKATKGVKDYAESLKKAGQTTLGIDELNIVKQEDNAQNFETAKVEANELNDSMSSLGQSLKTIFSDIGRLLKPILNIVQLLLADIMKVVSFALNIVSQILTPVIDMLSFVLDIVGEIYNALSPVIVSIFHLFFQLLSPISEMLYGAFDILKAFKPVLDAIVFLVKTLVVPAMAVLAVFETLFLVLKGIVKTLRQVITLDWGNIGNTWNDIGKEITQAWEKIDKTAIDLFGGKTMAPTFATGGFVEDGFFFANHSELVGQFSNGQTAVANNEQIIEGIKQGVYEAMTLAGGNNQQGAPSIMVYLDSREIAKRVEERQFARKDNGLSGGYKYGS